MKNIAITVDKNYCIHAAVMLYSLLSNNKSTDIYVHIILNFKNPFFKIPMKYVLNRKRCPHKFYFIDEKDIAFAKDLIITYHISIATYFRLFLPSILKHIDKVLFLDSDIIVDGNIDELYAADIQQHSLAAVIDNGAEAIDNDDNRIAVLGLKYGYFNAGVMLLNLHYLRENNYELKFEDFIRNHPDKIKFWDQDVLNVVTQGTVKSIDKKWNFLSQNYDEKDLPVIIHFAGIHKPWDGYSQHISKDKYFQYLQDDKFLFFLNTMYNLYFKAQRRISNIFK